MGLWINKPKTWCNDWKHILRWLAFIAIRVWRRMTSLLTGRRQGSGNPPGSVTGITDISVGAVAQGVRGDAMVVTAQSYLYILGFPLGKTGPNHNGVDGIVGPVTRAALAAFQRMVRIGGDGGLDLLTCNELKRVCSLGLTIRDLAQKAHQSGVRFEILHDAAAADFVNAVYYHALIDEMATKVPAAVTTAQAILESNYGRQTPTDLLTGKCSNNLFGVKGKGPAGSVTCWTKELDQATGNWVRTVAQYQAYHSFTESLQSRARLWEAETSASEPGQGNGCGDPFAFVARMANDGQIPDRPYATNLIQIMKDWGFL